MNRRSFFSVIGAAAVVSKSEAKAQPRRLVDVADVNNPGFCKPVKVLVDGIDVSNRCYQAELWSDGTGTAYCHKVVRCTRSVDYMARMNLLMKRGRVSLKA